MVVDDSAVTRGLLARSLTADPRINVVASCPNGEVALSTLDTTATDVVLLDIEMPVMDGMTALPLMLERHPALKVIMVSTLSKRNAEVTLRALQLGASDYLPKPEASLAGAEEFNRDLLQKVRALGRQPAESAARTAPAATSAPRPAARPAPAVRTRPSVLAIGASTGGPPALLKLFEELRGSVKQPILLTQHMPAAFTPLLADQLTRVSGRPCAEARDGEPVEPGRCYIAPGGWHMVVRFEGNVPTLGLNQEPPENFCRPAVDPMLRSVAKVYGSSVLALILTGMGADGAKGCEAVAEAGGRFVVQDEASSVVWGMPGAALATGRAEGALPLDEIAPWIKRVMDTAL